MATPQPEDPYGVTLAWLLAQEALGLRLVEPEAVPTVSLRWAHAIEVVDPTPFLDGGELVLTTGLRMPRDHAGQEAYVERLAAAGVVGVAFGIGVRFDAIPLGLRQACRRSAMPLIEVPLPTPFVAITQAVAAHRAEQQNAAMHRAVAFQRQMTRATLCTRFATPRRMTPSRTRRCSICCGACRRSPSGRAPRPTRMCPVPPSRIAHQRGIPAAVGRGSASNAGGDMVKIWSELRTERLKEQIADLATRVIAACGRRLTLTRGGPKISVADDNA